MISVMLQDGPFLVMRMLLIFRYGVLSYTNLFFTSKNTLVLVLQFYRLLVLFCQKTDKSTLVITQDGVSTAGNIDSKIKTGSLKITGTPKIARRQLSLDVTREIPEDLLQRKRSSLMRQDSINDSTQSDDTDVIELAADDSQQENNDGDVEDETTEMSSATAPSPDDKRKSKKKKKKKEGKKKDDKKEDRKKVSKGDKSHWREVRKVASAIAFLNEAGNCRTVLVNAGGKEHTLVIVDEERAEELEGIDKCDPV